MAGTRDDSFCIFPLHQNKSKLSETIVVGI